MAPAKYRDRVPRVEEVNGQRMWVFDGHPVGRYSAGGVVARDGSKEESDVALHHWSGDEIHEGAYNPRARLAVMDDCGIDVQVIFPSTIGFYGRYPWASHPPSTRLAIGGTLLFIGNARVVVNLILAGMFDRYPDLKMVSVESGCGWIPFILEALDYEMEENAPTDLAKMSKKPSEYFRSNLYATYWFERNQGKLGALFEAVGEDSILFATDFPHPTCLYPRPVERATETMAALSPDVRAKILGENARKLYRL